MPSAVALQPGVSDVITRFEVLAEDRLGLVRVVTEYGGIANNAALSFLDLDSSRIARRERRDVGDQLRLVEKAAFLVGEDAVVNKVFFPRQLITGNDGIVEFLSASDQFVMP